MEEASILLGIICAVVADCQDRNLILGFVWGCLFGILALIIYLIIGKKETNY